MSHPQTFTLQRDEDETGVSGTGVVAHGVIFPDGRAAMRWATGTASTACYDSIDDVIEIHGHNGKTRVMFDVCQPLVLQGEPRYPNREAGIQHDGDPHFHAAKQHGDYPLLDSRVLEDEDDRCRPAEGYHSTPHKGCILR